MMRPTFAVTCVTAFLVLGLTTAHSHGQQLPQATAAAIAAGEKASKDAGPCPFTPIDINKWGRRPFQNPPNVSSKGRILSTMLTTRYTLPSTTTLAGCPLKLRTYDGSLIGRTLRLKPGDVLDLQFANRLPIESPAEVEAQFQQQNSQAHLDTRPHSYNTTNLHTHGLHVSPSGISDNVLLAIAPQTRVPYRIAVPKNHPSGSFWYHAHAHGSTAIQVGSGMAGALIIEDDEARIPAALRAANRNEKVMVFQTILYDTYGQANDITAFFPDSSATKVLCEQGKSGCTWQSSNRRTTINGQIVPVIRMRPGEVQRWRMIDSAFRETINVRLEGHSLYEIALDGIYLGRIDTWSPTQSVELQPGYRSDVLVKASLKPGTYRLVDAASDASRSLRAVAERENLLAEIIVEGAPLDMPLPTSQEMAPLAPFPGVNLQAQPVLGVQQAIFKLGSDLNTNASTQRNYFQVNYEAFNPSRIRYVQLNTTDNWNLTTVGDPFPNGIPPLPHVFHIHVNPFQYARTGPDGQPETVWKDTLLIPAGQTINIYTQYLDFTGQFVMHCHILDHEDLGMMEVVEVVKDMPPRTTPGHGGTPRHH